MHRGLTERGIERGAASYVLAGESLDDPVVGRLVDRGLDDELKGTAYAVVDGVDGRTHHIKLPDLDAAGDSAPGSIVELRKFDDAQGERASRSPSAPISTSSDQITPTGATWLDRQAIAREPVASAAAASAPRCARRWTSAPSIWSAKVSPSAKGRASASRRN
jgi:hypothetical protein